MNLEEMETALKRYGFDSSDPLKVWLNAAMHEVEADHDWPFLEGGIESTLSTSAGTPGLFISNQLGKVISVRDLTNNRKLVFYDTWRYFREVEEPEAKGQPLIYTLAQITSSINLWPIPEGVYKIEVVGQLITKDMVVAGDTPKTTREWPVAMHYAIVLKAAIMALFAENEEERGEKLQKQFDQLMERLRRKYGDRTMDEPDSVVDVMGYGPTPSAYDTGGM